MCLLVEHKLIPDSLEAQRDEVLVNSGAQAALSMLLGYGAVAPIKYNLVVSQETLAAMCQHLSTLGARTHRMLLTQGLVCKNLYRREHHVGGSVFEAALTANYATKVADIPLLTARASQGLFSGSLYWSAKSRSMGLTYLQAALVHKATGYTRHLPLVYGSLPARARRLESASVDGAPSERGIRSIREPAPGHRGVSQLPRRGTAPAVKLLRDPLAVLD